MIKNKYRFKIGQKVRVANETNFTQGTIRARFRRHDNGHNVYVVYGKDMESGAHDEGVTDHFVFWENVLSL